MHIILMRYLYEEVFANTPDS